MTDDRFAAFADAPWRTGPWRPPEAARKVPTMLCEDEQRLLYWLGADWAAGIGAVCDLGCFAGGSTARMASGLAAQDLSAPVHAFDFFTVAPDHKQKFLYANGVPRFWGSNLLPTARRLLKPWRDRITFHKIDVETATWPDDPIEILFIDVMKTPATADAILANFFPALIPGRSVIVHQDYQHWRQPWIAAQMARLGAVMRPVAWAESGTVVFAVDALPDPGMLAAARVGEMADDEMTDLLKQALGQAGTKSARHQMARAILALEDMPGCRLPYRFDPEAINWPRVKKLLDAHPATF